MKIHLKRLNEAVHFESTNAEGLSLQFDGSPGIGGEGKGVRPMEGVLMSLAACSSIDVVSILKKMRQPLEHLEIQVEGQRAQDQVPAVFTDIHLHFMLSGALNTDKVARALELSITKYCSVVKMIEQTVKVTYDFEILDS
jgi:putative redox protein